MTSLTIRPATPADASALVDLAGLDCARPLTGDVLVAETAGRPVAALALAAGRAVADPFVPTSAALGVLRVRAGQIRAAAAPGVSRRPRRLSLRAASG
jgi:hypothetical protein